MRSSDGCWTCRLRRKKCDEKHPVCDACAFLQINCHYSQEKPEWMDGGQRQEEVAEQLKREVREKYHLRRGRGVPSSDDRISDAAAATGDWIMLPQREPTDSASICEILQNHPQIYDRSLEPSSEASASRLQRGVDCKSNRALGSVTFGRSDTILLMFYLEHLLSFLFPFYRPSPFQGGRSWILEMMISSPVVRQATLCQSSYFFSLARGATECDILWDTVLEQTKDAFGVLGQALQVIESSNITEHMHGAARIMASIMHVQRFETTVLSFENCQAHLNAALALFKQLLDSVDDVDPEVPSAKFQAVLTRLGPPSWVLPSQCFQIPSAEQAAFRFSSTLLILDDIIASTVHQERPELYEYHRGLLEGFDGRPAQVDLEAVVGCQNWALLHIGEIAALNAWKLERTRAGKLNIMELVHCATPIQHSLQAHLDRLWTEPQSTSRENDSLLNVLMPDYGQQSNIPTGQSSNVTRVWAHAALIYLYIVVSGWQPASVDVRYHVAQIIELLTREISPPVLLRTMVWPFCVAGCLAEPAEETHFRTLVEALQPPSVFGTVRKAFEIMENVWRNRDTEDAMNHDLATCFKTQGDLVLLI